jgi:PAS domain S-box-containing protein
MIADEEVSNLKEQETILIVDDDHGICRTMELIFKAKGYKIVSAHNGQDALAIMEKNDVNLGILDIKLPDIDGTTLLSKLHEKFPNSDFLTVTGYATVETAVQALKFGALAYITKPIDTDDVVRTVSLALERQRMIRAKKRAEEALQESEEKFRLLAENMKEGLWMISIDDPQLIFLNSSIMKMYGRTHEEMFVDIHEWSQWVVEEDRELVSNALDDLLLNKKEYLIEFRVAYPDSSIFWVKSKTSIIEDETGHPYRAVGTDEDITERKVAEEAIRRNQESLADAQRIAQLGNWDWDLGNHNFTCSDELLRIFNLSPNIFEGTYDAFLKYVHPDDREKVDNTRMLIQKENEVVAIEHRIVRTDGVERIVHHRMRLYCDKKGRPTRFLGTIQDVTTQKKMEQTLKESETWFRGIFEESPMSIDVFDFNGDLLAANRACINFAGVKEVDDLRNYNLFSDPNFSKDLIDGTRKGETHFFESQIDFSLIRKLGLFPTKRNDVADVECTISPLIIGKDETISGYLVQIIEITDKKLAAEIIKTERDRAQLYLDIAGVMFVALDRFGRVTLVNEKTCEILACGMDDIIGQDWVAKFVPKRDRNSVKEVFHQLLDDGVSNSSGSYENLVISTDGKERLIAWHNNVLRDKEGKVTGLLSSGEDITETKLSQELLVAEKEFTENALNTQIDTFFVYEQATGKAVRWNKAWQEISGYSDQEIASIKAKVSYYIGEDLEKAALAERLALKEGSAKVELTLIAKDGKKIPFDYAISRIKGKTGESDFIVSVGRNITERKAAEEALRESEASYRRLAENLPGVVYRIFLQEDRIEFLNERLFDITGLHQDDLLQKETYPLIPYIHPEDKNQVVQVLNESIISNESFEVKYRIIQKDGSIKWMQERGRPTFDDNRLPLHIDGVIFDITKKQVAEEELRRMLEINQVIAILSNTINEPDITVDKISESILEYSKKLTRSTQGYVSTIEVETMKNIRHAQTLMISSDAKDEQLSIHFKADNQGKFPGLFGYSLNTGEAFFTNSPAKHSSAKGFTKYYHELKNFLSVPVNFGGEIVGQITLANSEKNYEEYDLELINRFARLFGIFIVRLRDVEQLRYHAELLGDISDAVISTDLENKIQSWNKAAEEIYGWILEEVKGKPVSEILQTKYTKEGNTSNNAEDALKLSGRWSGEVIQRRKDGIDVPILASVSLIKDVNQKMIGIVSVNKDMTDQKKAQAQVQYERDRAMLYLDLMGHDIRNKLQAIMMGLDIFSEVVDNEEYSPILHDVMDAAEKIKNLISKVKKTEKLTSVPLEQTQIARVVTSVAKSFSETHPDIDVNISISENESVVMADEFLDDMLETILENAIEHNPRERKSVWIGLEEISSGVQISIGDNGIGIPDERKKELFDKTRRFGGVGLHQVKQVIDKYSGNIFVVNRDLNDVESGTVFQIRIPSCKEIDTNPEEKFIRDGK